MIDFSILSSGAKWYNNHSWNQKRQDYGRKIILPQNTRLMGLCLVLSEEGLDVFATCTTGVWSRPKRGTSCFSSLIGTIPVSKIPSCVFIYFYFFSIGFVVALHIREYRRTAFWRTKMLIPLFVVTLLLPLVSVIPPVEVPFIAFGTGWWCWPLQGSLIETTLMWSLWLPAITARCWRPCTESLEEGRFGRVSASGYELRNRCWKLCCRSDHLFSKKTKNF